MKSTTEAAEVKVGDTLPMSLTLKEMPAGSDKPVDVVLSDLLQGKKVAIFGVPGAFTPGCSKSHLPSFITAQEELKAKGVEETFCLATNDAFVMEVSCARSFIVQSFCSMYIEITRICRLLMVLIALS